MAQAFFVMDTENHIQPFSIFPGTECGRLLLSRTQYDSLGSNSFDYDVLSGGEVVGRIYFDEKPLSSRWFWEIRGSDVHGSAETLHYAKLAFLDSWRKLNKASTEVG